MGRWASVMVVAIGALAALGADGCKGTGGARPAGAPVGMATLQGEWTLRQIDGHDVPAGGRAPTLVVAPDGKVSGFAGVNRFSGTLEIPPLSEGRLKLSPMISTKMAGPPEAMATEDRYLNALQRATAARVEGDALVLSDPNDAVLRFERAR